MRKLSTQILAGQAVILTITVLVGFALFVRGERNHLDHVYGQRAAAIAAATAQVPDIRRCLAVPAGCGNTVQQIATGIQHSTGASYVVVIDMDRVRHSHPIARLIGQRVEEPIATLDGEQHVSIDAGATGRSANGKAPLYGPDGTMVGEVSVGVRESTISAALLRELPAYAAWFGIALAVGGVVSLLLASRLKRRTFGLELDEIAHLLREREAVLHGIREGMIAFDGSGRVAMMNDEARRLAGLGGVALGARLEDELPEGRLRDVLCGVVAGKDEVVLTDDFCLTVNRMPVALAGHPAGAVVTLRDRTELAGLLRELDSVQGLTDALRAQQHEFSNRMHTVAGLLELGETDEAVRYLTDLSGAEAGFAESLRARVASPVVVALLLAKSTVAAERGVTLTISDDSWLGVVPAREQALATILGNLIDNAIDAVSGSGHPGQVRVTVIEETDVVHVEVTDDGPGLPAGAAHRVFADGFSTKSGRGTLRRGLGLALVHRVVQRLGGRIAVSEGPGAVFTVELPKEAA